MARRHTASELSYRLVVGFLAAVAVMILVGPILVVLITSFTTAPSLKFPPPGFSFKWYEALFDPVRSRHIHVAASNTLSVGMGATIIVTMLGVAAAVGLAGKRGSWARALENGFLGPLILPTLAYGFAALMFFSLLGFRTSLPLLVIGHAVVIAPFVFRTTLASLSQLDPALLESSASLGVGRFYNIPPSDPAADRAGDRGRRVPVVHRLHRQRSRLAVPVERAHGYAADPHVGHDGVDLGCACRCRVRGPDHLRDRADGRYGAARRLVEADVGVAI